MTQDIQRVEQPVNVDASVAKFTLQGMIPSLDFFFFFNESNVFMYSLRLQKQLRLQGECNTSVIYDVE